MRQKLLLTVCFTVFLATQAYGSCSAPQNAIEAENCNTGSNSWAVNNPDSTIQGFASDISYNAGDTVNFKISTPATAYHISILRMGYYQGNGARLITTISPSAKLPQTQPACLSDTSTNLVDCGNWAVSASWTIPTTAVSGIYFADIVRNDTGGANQVFFVVRNDSSHSDVLFQTADESWEAYNGYGGHSLYGSNAFDLTNRAYKVSYNRPFA
ncbi:MAG TPA: N,N-dimethylformamidase beta subunit family domain-containing protein, partial [Terriglobales bacterium]|nr:N,N-dimethylformamidase beta subunit family domain-containing protein [Terriglobales bacterium]